ncbi:hypothetical protein [Pseudomonas sp. CAM1A]|uniref:hypothetical protein n=1 Tax=Pseudomonas sp. CAM1A TaxID=3231717 RepID=UPI0039C72F42
MDDQTHTTPSGNLPDSDPGQHASIIDELRAEFRKLEREEGGCFEPSLTDAGRRKRANEAIGYIIDLTLGSGKTAHYKTIVTAIERARLVLNALDDISEAIGLTASLQRQARIWTSVLTYSLAVLARLYALLAYSRHAVLSIPLHADGPELSGYKHRLR